MCDLFRKRKLRPQVQNMQKMHLAVKDVFINIFLKNPVPMTLTNEVPLVCRGKSRYSCVTVIVAAIH